MSEGSISQRITELLGSDDWVVVAFNDDMYTDLELDELEATHAPDAATSATPSQRSAAARIRMEWDRKRGKVTPQWVVDLATITPAEPAPDVLGDASGWEYAVKGTGDDEPWSDISGDLFYIAEHVWGHADATDQIVKRRPAGPWVVHLTPDGQGAER